MAGSRRQVLGAAAGAALSVGLAACSKPATGPAAPAASALPASEILPLHDPSRVVAPTIAGDGAWVEDLFLDYPRELVRTVAATPGRGSSFQVMTCSYGPPTPSATSYTAALEKALGARLDQRVVGYQDYNTKLTAMLAAGDGLPDVLSTQAWDAPPRLEDALGQAFVDLTRVLGGHGVDEYPNLARLPRAAWMGGVWDNRLYSYPGRMAHSMPVVPIIRRDLWEKAGITSVKGTDELLAMCRELTRPAQHQYALGQNLPGLVLRMIYGMYFDGMDVDPTGRVQMYWERADYPEALELMRTLAKHYVHPGLLATDGDALQAMRQGQVAMAVDGAAAFLELNSRAGLQASTPGFDAGLWLPSDPAGRPASIAVGNPVLYSNFISRRVTGDRLAELLRVLDFLAAPFGSREWELVNYGTAGVDFTRVDGAPGAVPPSVGEAYLATASGPAVLAAWGDRGAEASAKEYQQLLRELAPRFRFVETVVVHPRIPSSLAGWRNGMDDLETAIYKGQRPLSDLGGALKAWRSRYGEQVREIYQQALEASSIKG